MMSKRKRRSCARCGAGAIEQAMRQDAGVFVPHAMLADEKRKFLD